MGLVNLVSRLVINGNDTPKNMGILFRLTWEADVQNNMSCAIVTSVSGVYDHIICSNRKLQSILCLCDQSSLKGVQGYASPNRYSGVMLEPQSVRAETQPKARSNSPEVCLKESREVSSLLGLGTNQNAAASPRMPLFP